MGIQHYRRTAAARLAVLIGCTAISAAYAQDDNGDSSEKRIETVSVTASRIERPTSNESQAISIITEEEIRSIGHSHINEALNRVPGVWISRNNGQEHLTAIRSAVLTGPGSCGAFYFAEDGIPLRGLGFCNVNSLFDVNSEQASRIEVLRGPGTAVHGSNALNGVINVISTAAPKEREARIALEGGPHDYGRVKLQYGDTAGKHGFLLSFHGESDGGYKDDSGYDQQKLNLRHDYQGEVWQISSLLSASNLNQETAGYLYGEDAYKDDAQKRDNPNPEAYRNSQSIRYYSRFSREGRKDSRFVVTPYLRYTEMDFLQHFLPGTPREENGERTVGLQTAFYHNPSETLTLHNGFDMELTKAYLQQTQEAPGFGPFPTGKQYDYDVDGAYAAWFIGSDWRASEKSHLTLGLRYDIQLYKYDNQMIDGNTAEDGSPCATTPCRYARPSDDTNQFRNPSYHLGYIYSATEYSDLIFNAAHGFRAPQATELYRLQASQLNANLDEESLDSLEIGLRTELSRVQWQVSAYWMKKDELIIQDSDRNNINGGATLSKGVELSLNWMISPTLSWSFQGSYAKHTYANNVAGSDGNDLDTAPRQLASTELKWKPWHGSQLALEVIYQGRYYLDATNEPEYPGHTLAHLRWRQDYGSQIYSVVRVNNLGDIDYAERADYAFGNYRYFVGEPRSVFVEVGFEF